MTGNRSGFKSVRERLDGNRSGFKSVRERLDGSRSGFKSVRERLGLPGLPLFRRSGIKSF